MEKLVTGQKFTLTSREVEGTNEICSVSYKELPRDVAAGGRIMLDDGLIELGIDEVSDTDIVCTVKNDGTIKTKMCIRDSCGAAGCCAAVSLAAARGQSVKCSGPYQAVSDGLPA